MSGLSTHQSVFRVAKSDSKGNGSLYKDKVRNRQPVSCGACRSRKLKCDRQKPCTACGKRNVACIYTNAISNETSLRTEDPKSSEAKARLQALEQLVSEMLESSQAESPSNVGLPQNTSLPTPPSICDTGSHGHLDVQGPETQYRGATHWATVLENIRDIQGVLGTHADRTTDSHMNQGILLAPPEGLDVAVDTSRPLTLKDVCDTLPPRAVVNKILATYFTPSYIQPPVMHKGKFSREIEAFWHDPTSVSFLWISMLFSALWIGCRISLSGADDVPMKDLFFVRAGQALVTGKYQRARPYSVEACMLYAQCKYMQKDDPDSEPWLFTGVATRLALKMGFHRDPSRLSNISPFEGEMRRRTFSIIEAFDLLLSFQAGLPPILQEEECDVDPPRNLYDQDFDEDCTAVPPSRPVSDPTPMLFWCTKVRMAKVSKRVIRHALSLKPAAYENALQLDKALHEMHDSVPPSLRIRPVASSFTDPTYVILHRITIELLYLKSLCVLHRTSLTRNRPDADLAGSRKMCTDSALKILHIQAELYETSQPGGRFHDDKWVLNSLTLHDFLLAAMITALDLYESHTRGETSGPTESNGTQAERYDALRLSHAIWQFRSSISRDAQKASKVLAFMLAKIPRSGADLTPSSGTLNGSTVSPFPARASSSASSGSSTLHLSENVVPQVYTNGDFAFDVDGPVSTMFNDSDVIDWEALDQYLIDHRREDPLQI